MNRSSSTNPIRQCRRRSRPCSVGCKSIFRRSETTIARLHDARPLQSMIFSRSARNACSPCARRGFGYSNDINNIDRRFMLNGGPAIKRPTLNGALVANGLKGAYLIQIRRGHAAAYLQAAASHRSGSGLLNVPALNANLRSAIS